MTVLEREITRDEVTAAMQRLKIEGDIDAVTTDEVQTAYRSEMRKTHPDSADLHFDDVAMLIRSAQAARSLLLAWIAGRPAPCSVCGGKKVVPAGLGTVLCPKCGKL